MNICLINGCNLKHYARGFCCNHYYSWKGTALAENREKKCIVEGCHRLMYAKGLCKRHYALNKRNGVPEYKPKKFCQVQDCNRPHSGNGFCSFHYGRNKNGTPFERPFGTKGLLNPRWNNGKSEYPNHSLMKKVRLEILARDHYKCQIKDISKIKKCGKYAYMVHHKDFSKDNHSKENLVAVCPHHNTVLRNPNKKSK